MEKNNITFQLEQYLTETDREMIFFKWYEKNVDSLVKSPQLHTKFKYIRTIGVSVFNKQKSTSKHFGPFRMTYRVLYNLNEIDSKDIYIQVGKHRHYWHQNKLFIFDDTLRHQSINNSTEKRYCAFIDIERPSYIPFIINLLIKAAGIVLNRANHIFYKNWKFIK